MVAHPLQGVRNGVRLPVPYHATFSNTASNGTTISGVGGTERFPPSAPLIPQTNAAPQTDIPYPRHTCKMPALDEPPRRAPRRHREHTRPTRNHPLPLLRDHHTRTSDREPNRSTAHHRNKSRPPARR